MAAQVLGHIDWDLDQDKDGHRDYSVTWLVAASTPSDGPQQVRQAFGLPAIGDPWLIGFDDDPWAFCWPDAKCTPLNTKEPNYFWTVKQKFSTRPLRRCQDTPIEDPLLEPYKISGSYVKYRREAQRDKNGLPIKYTSHERIRGAEVEYEEPFPTVVISFNSASSQLPFFGPVMGHLNSEDMWGLGARRILLNEVEWERKVYGRCNYYWWTQYTFEVDDSEDGDLFDRRIANVGSMCLKGTSPGSPFKATPYTAVSTDPYDPDATRLAYENPKNFEAYVDLQGHRQRVYLNRYGIPLVPGDEDYHYIEVKKHKESDLLVLGVPSSF